MGLCCALFSYILNMLDWLLPSRVFLEPELLSSGVHMTKIVTAINREKKLWMNCSFTASVHCTHSFPLKKVKGNFSVFTQWLDGGITSATHQRPRSTVRGIMGRGMSHFLVWCKPQLITSERESRGRHSSGEADANMASFGNQTSLWRGTRPTSKELWIQTTGNNSVCRIAWLYLIKSRRQDIC